MITAEVLAFLKGDSHCIALFEAAEAAILACGESAMTVQKSQISWGNPLKFAFLSFGKGSSLILTFGLNARTEHPKIFQAVEPYPGRWTHHMILSDVSDIDSTVGHWLKDAYAFAVAKKR